LSVRFTRRAFNRALLYGAAALAAPRAAARPTLMATPLFDFAIAGGWYHGLPAARDGLAVGEKLVLRGEPANPFDANAVAVLRGDGMMLGYLPRAANAPISRLLERKACVEAIVVGRLDYEDESEIPDDFAFTGFADGDPRIRLTLIGGARDAAFPSAGKDQT
jgi:hypothetical protein